MRRQLLRGLYAITPDGLGEADLIARAEAALRGGAGILQYRDKSIHFKPIKTHAYIQISSERGFFQA